MANKCIYFLIVIITYLQPSETYFLSDDLGTNLPDRFGDPINENWQDKRSAQNDYSSFSKEFDNSPRSSHNINKESSDFDYKNGNAETEGDEDVEQRLKKRQNKRHFDEPLNEADIRRILTKLSYSDREALNAIINDGTATIDVDKRELLKRKFENNFHFNKRNNRGGKNFKVHCKGLSCEEYDQGYDQIPLREEEDTLEEDTYNQCPEKIASKRKLKFKRSNDLHSTSRENILQAKISLLKDNYKRNSEIQSLEDSAKRRSRNNKIKSGHRKKRSIDSKLLDNSNISNE